MSAPSDNADLHCADRIPVRVWCINSKQDLVAIHFRHEDLKACGLQAGDRLILDINGAVVRGDVCLDLKGPWLGRRS